MADFTTTYFDHAELLPQVTFVVEQEFWIGTELAAFMDVDPVGVIQTPEPTFGILWPKR